MNLLKYFTCRVKLTAELETQVSTLGPGARRDLAKKFRAYAHQLEFSALIMEIDSNPNKPKPPPRLKKLPLHKAQRN